MDQPSLRQRRSTTHLLVAVRAIAVVTLCNLGTVALAATKPALPAAVPKWSRFEITLPSSVAYANPMRDVTVTAVFVSPLGETNRVTGFWDGEKTWRVRFAPDLPGKWTYRTTCSDKTNASLQAQSGEFTCVAPLTKTALDRHGPLQVARDHHHFEHADRTPFLWLGDAAWNGGRLSALADWQLYAEVRASQKFTAAQWTVAPGKDANGETAFSGRSPLTINVKFFQRLDAKVEALNRAGLLSAIAPLQEFGGAEAGLSEDDAALLMRYAVARWGANQVAWIVAVEGDSMGKRVDRWKRIGRAVFGSVPHAPVILMPGETHWLLDEFRDETWLDAFALPKMSTDESGLQWMLSGPLSVEWKKSPPRPIVNLSAPPETSADGNDARRMLWWSLFQNPTAGASYTATPVINWDTNLVTNINMLPHAMPAWHSALFLPGAKGVASAAEFLGTIDFAQLRPLPRALGTQPGFESPRRHVSVASLETKNLTVVYVPEDRKVELANMAFVPSATATWLNVRTGERQPATAMAGATTTLFSTPEPGDWLLVLKAGK